MKKWINDQEVDAEWFSDWSKFSNTSKEIIKFYDIFYR